MSDVYAHDDVIELDYGHYLVFTPDTTLDHARAEFVRRYGVWPQKCGRLYPGREVWAGPVVQEGPGQRQPGKVSGSL